MSVENSYGNISNIFVRLIGYLNLILQYESYQEDYSQYKQILNIITNWALQYEKNRNLNFINNDDLVNIYETSDNLQTKYICNDKTGSESEFSDYIVNLIWDLRVVYKKMKGSNKNG